MMDTPEWLTNNPYIFVRSIRILNMLVAIGSGAAILLLNEKGYDFMLFKNLNDLIPISVGASFVLAALSFLFFICHWLRITVKTSIEFWIVSVVLCGMATFVLFMFDIAYTSLCDEDDKNCVPVNAMIVAASLKFLSMLFWFADAAVLLHIHYKAY